MSIRWTVLEADRSEVFIDMLRAGSVGMVFRLASYAAPAQNAAVADRAGAIGIRSAGLYPIRPGSGRGDVVFDGTTRRPSDSARLPAGRAAPHGPEPPRRLPGVRQPGAARSPDKPRLPGQRLAHPLAGHADQPAAACRGEAHPRGPAADVQTRSGQRPGRSVRAGVPGGGAPGGGGRATDAELATATRLLSEWDRRYTRDNQRAVLFEAAMEELFLRAFDELVDPAPADTKPDLVSWPGSDVLACLLRDPSSPWWDDRRTTGRIEDRTRSWPRRCGRPWKIRASKTRAGRRRRLALGQGPPRQHPAPDRAAGPLGPRPAGRGRRGHHQPVAAAGEARPELPHGGGARPRD